MPYDPSILVWTGAGWHVYFLLKEPAEGAEELARAELAMRHLAEGLEGDFVHDRARILRVPGTFNLKHGEPRLVKMESCDSALRYGLEELEKMVEELPRNAERDSSRSGKVRRGVLNGPIRDGGRNVALASIAGSLQYRGLDAKTICVVLLKVNRLRCEPPLSETKVVEIGRSVGRYTTGSPRYRRSSARRVYHNGETR
ncbi:MAG: primase alpha helix C-terminal domain-containing protein [Actinobacteria bacterium]|nr:primase alpha helix C-terminal domain-containing protein [Actinomycetota bacterium]